MTLTNTTHNDRAQAIRDALIRNRIPVEDLAAQHPDRAVRHVFDGERLEHEVEQIKQALIAGGHPDVEALGDLHGLAVNRLGKMLGELADAVGITGHRYKASLIGSAKDPQVEAILVAHESESAANVQEMRDLLAGS